MLGAEATSFDSHLSVLGPSHFPRPTEGSHQFLQALEPQTPEGKGKSWHTASLNPKPA